jgi:hypothetical protein
MAARAAGAESVMGVARRQKTARWPRHMLSQGGRVPRLTKCRDTSTSLLKSWITRNILLHIVLFQMARGNKKIDDTCSFQNPGMGVSPRLINAQLIPLARIEMHTRKNILASEHEFRRLGASSTLPATLSTVSGGLGRCR